MRDTPFWLTLRKIDMLSWKQNIYSSLLNKGCALKQKVLFCHLQFWKSLPQNTYPHFTVHPLPLRSHPRLHRWYTTREKNRTLNASYIVYEQHLIKIINAPLKNYHGDFFWFFFSKPHKKRKIQFALGLVKILKSHICLSCRNHY